MAYYRDFREHLQALEKRGKLFRVKEPFCKDTEIHPLVRWQFRGLPEAARMAFYFEKVTGARGQKYETPVVVGALAASREVFSIAMQCEPQELMQRLSEALHHPIPPKVISSGPCQDEIHIGKNLLEHGGLEEFPIPISTPGFDVAPFTTFSHWVTKDPETGIYNIGNYRGQLKSPARLGCFTSPPQHLGQHWVKCHQKGIPLQAALVIGTAPNISFAANTKVPYESDEYEVAGAIAGEPVEVVQCKTVDLLVPATAEVVFEGNISTEYLEPEAPFGETPGYMSQRNFTYYFEITAIMHRKKPIWASILSQFPPSESTKLRSLSWEPTYFKFLRYDSNIPSVTDLAFHESSGAGWFLVIQMKKTNPAQPWQALNAALAYDPIPKILIIVDQDIDPRDPDLVNWAVATRVQPRRDVRIVDGRYAVMDYSAIHPTDPVGVKYPEPDGASALLIDATCKWGYPPTSLPKKEYMERAKERWEKLGLPKLEPRYPWHGYSLGYWTDEDEEEATWAVKGEYAKTGERAIRLRKKVTGGH
jgi:4-hydroxy-3-polyprenylbenzoate decarboxylase